MAQAQDQTTTDSRTSDTGVGVEEVYRALHRGVGREQVTDGNVEELIQMAKLRGDTQLEYLLREWRSPCGEDAAAPPLGDVLGNPPPR